MNGRLAILLACCVLLSVSVLNGADIQRKPVSENYTDDQTGMVFPSRIGTFFKTEVTKNRNPILGSTIHYQDENDSVADIYIYSLREDVTQKDIISPEDFAKERDSVVRIILGMAKRNKMIDSVREIPLQVGGMNNVLFNQFEIVVDGAAVCSRLVMMLSANRTRIVKCRISYPADNADAAKEAVHFETMLTTGLLPGKKN